MHQYWGPTAPVLRGPFRTAAPAPAPAVVRWGTAMVGSAESRHVLPGGTEMAEGEAEGGRTVPLQEDGEGPHRPPWGAHVGGWVERAGRDPHLGDLGALLQHRRSS